MLNAKIQVILFVELWVSKELVYMVKTIIKIHSSVLNIML